MFVCGFCACACVHVRACACVCVRCSPLLLGVVLLCFPHARRTLCCSLRACCSGRASTMTPCAASSTPSRSVGVSPQHRVKISLPTNRRHGVECSDPHDCLHWSPSCIACAAGVLRHHRAKRRGASGVVGCDAAAGDFHTRTAAARAAAATVQSVRCMCSAARDPGSACALVSPLG